MADSSPSEHWESPQKEQQRNFPLPKAYKLEAQVLPFKHNTVYFYILDLFKV